LSATLLKEMLETISLGTKFLILNSYLYGYMSILFSFTLLLVGLRRGVSAFQLSPSFCHLSNQLTQSLYFPLILVVTEVLHMANSVD